MPQSQIVSPARYISLGAMAFADTDSSAIAVSHATPLPVSLAGSSASPLAGTASLSTVAGPFQPSPGATVVLALSGTWTGTVAVTRSIDGGVTRLPLTLFGSPTASFQGNCCEPVWEEADPAATLHLDITLASGSVTYRIA